MKYIENDSIFYDIFSSLNNPDKKL